MPATVILNGHEIQISSNGNVAQIIRLQGTDETKPYLPSSSFHQVEGTQINTGLVITDGTNSYVWIEVPISETERATNDSEIETALQTYATGYRGSLTDEWYDGSGKTASTNLNDTTGCGLTNSQYNELKSKMLNSIKSNGGFWIGQYEAGIEGTGLPRTAEGEATQTPVIQEGAYPYNYVTCSQAQERASTLSTGNYTSSLMFGIQWDLVCKFIETNATNPGSTVDTIQKAIKNNSKDWGNYNDANFDITKGKYSEDYGDTYTAVSGTYTKGSKSVLLTTGSTERNSLLNIYDFAGNVREWTLEKSSSSVNLCGYRGGNYGDYGSGRPASFRDSDAASGSDHVIGFRPTLY